MDSFTREEKNVRIQVPICNRTQNTEVTADISLPDYQPEIKRLLRIRATVHPADKYIGAGNTECSGTVDYVILYAGNDNSLYSVSKTEEYRFSVPLESSGGYDLSDGIVSDIQVLAETVGGRVISPRKLSVKCRLRSCVKLYAGKRLPDISGTSDSTLQMLRGNAECARMFLGSSEPVQLADEILLDSPAADLRVICAEGQAFVNEATAGSGVIQCRGEVCFKLMTASDSVGTPNIQYRRIPFTESIPADGTEVNCECSASGICTDITATVEEGRILCEVTVVLRGRAQRNEHISFLRDLYSTESEILYEKNTAVVPLALVCTNGHFSCNQTFKLSEVGMLPTQTVTDVQCVPTVTALEQENGKLFLNGKCRCLMILTEEEMSTSELELPFRYEIPFATSESVTDYDVQTDAIFCRARVDGERISVDAELAVCFSAMGEKRISMVSEMKFGEKTARSASVYTVCYPSAEDTLWSVAKRYHRSVSAIMEQNGLEGDAAADAEDSLSGIGYLLV